MKYFILLGSLGFLLNLTVAQVWTDPVNISKSGTNHSPSLTIDKNGILHCVWIKCIDIYNNSRLFYSKSSDAGMNWSEPVIITNNPVPYSISTHIISDTSGNLFITYDYDVHAYPLVKVHFIKFNISDSTWDDPVEIATGSGNNIIVDNSNRIYFFWFYGTEYYKYLENGILSETYSLYSWIQVPCFFQDFVIDSQNKIHCIGNRKISSYSVGAYFTYNIGTWSVYQDLSERSFFESGISLNSIGAPSFVWKQIITGSYNLRGTYYSRMDGDSAQQPTFLAEGTFYPVICLDYADKPHIIDNQGLDGNKKLVHRYFQNDVWQTEVLDSNQFDFNQNELLSRDNFLFLVYNKIDTSIEIPPEIHSGDVYFRKLELPPGIDENKDKLTLLTFPNPFSTQIAIKLPNTLTNEIKIKIFNNAGMLVFERNLKPTELINNTFIWKGNDNNGLQVSEGLFIIQISSRSYKISTSIIRINH
jgi:hypothetical protein